MSVPRLILRARALGVSLGLLSFAVTAHAADIGRCDTPENMTALLKAEGQRSLASGNQQLHGERLPDGTLRAANKIVGLIFTGDAEGKVGYILQADQPIGTKAGKICVAERFHNIRLYDARKPGLPAEALLKSTEADAARKCDQLAAKRTVAEGSCGFLTTMLRKTDPLGERVMLLGLGVKKQADGSWQPDGTLITITANMTGDGTARDGRGTLLFSVLPEGATVLGSVFTGIRYTETAQQLLAGRP